MSGNGSGSGSRSEYVYVGFDYLNFHLYVDCGCVDYGYNCFGLLIFWCYEFLSIWLSWTMNFYLCDCQVNNPILSLIIDILTQNK
jgi:hypothetical protein